MRQRKIKNFESRWEALQETGLCVAEPKKNKGQWGDRPGINGEVFIEIGCGKGKFICSQAERHPERLYIAIEGHKPSLLRAMEKAAEKGLKNLIFIGEFIDNIEEYFDKGELSGIFLNFSDPWPKKRNAKRRLTHTNYLRGYAEVLKEGSAVEFKTDNEGLFEFTLEELEMNEKEILELSRDLHNSNLKAKEITTEYEDKFKAAEKNINYVKFR